MSSAPLITREDLSHFSLPELNSLIYNWGLWARPEQLPPDHPSHPDPNPEWETWLAIAGRGWGKQLALDTLIPTVEEGLIPLSQVTINHTLFDEQGVPTRILALHPISTPEEGNAYRITFNDRTHIDACGDHLWVTTNHQYRKSYQRNITRSAFPLDWASAPPLTTSQIYQTQHRISHGKPVANHSIPCTLPLRLPSSHLPIDPYTLGYWLGNGASSSTTICCHAQDVSHLSAHLAHSPRRARLNDPLPHRAHFKIDISHQLNTLNLKRNKHIPLAYLRASADQRLALLRGFLDADGHYDGGKVEIAQVNHQLSEQLEELITSLGYYVTHSIKVPHIEGVSKNAVRILRFTPREELNPFLLPRKAELIHDSSTQRLRTRHRRIVGVVPIAPVPMRCLTVDSPNSMYLVTRAHIPTHNTRVGAEQVLRWVDQGYRRIHIVAPTTSDTRDVIVEGDSGILNIAHPLKRPRYEPSKRRLTFPNGAIALLFSAEEPERLRGPQAEALWCDEMAAWQYLQETWDQAMFGLRLGKHPQIVVTTTPKPLPLIRTLLEQAKKDPKRTVLSSGSTYDNRANLAKTFFNKVAQYEGTRLGKQELHAQLIDPRETGIIRHSWLAPFPHSIDLPTFEFIIQSYDTAMTEDTMDRKSKDPDPTASTTWGIFKLTQQVKRSLRLPDTCPYAYGILLLDAWSDMLGYPELRTRVKNEYHQSSYNDRKADAVLIENKGSGISLRQELQRIVPAVAYNPGRADKVERLHSVSHIPCRGLVFIPESRANPGQFVTWADEFIEQLTTFPLVVHDDYVDTFSQALAYARDLGYLRIDEDVDTDEVEEYVKPQGNPYS